MDVEDNKISCSKSNSLSSLHENDQSLHAKSDSMVDNSPKYNDSINKKNSEADDNVSLEINDDLSKLKKNDNEKIMCVDDDNNYKVKDTNSVHEEHYEGFLNTGNESDDKILKDKENNIEPDKDLQESTKCHQEILNFSAEEVTDRDISKNFDNGRKVCVEDGGNMSSVRKNKSEIEIEPFPCGNTMKINSAEDVIDNYCDSENVSKNQTEYPLKLVNINRDSGEIEDKNISSNFETDIIESSDTSALMKLAELACETNDTVTSEELKFCDSTLEVKVPGSTNIQKSETICNLDESALKTKNDEILPSNCKSVQQLNEKNSDNAKKIAVLRNNNNGLSKSNDYSGEDLESNNAINTGSKSKTDAFISENLDDSTANFSAREPACLTQGNESGVQEPLCNTSLLNKSTDHETKENTNINLNELAANGDSLSTEHNETDSSLSKSCNTLNKDMDQNTCVKNSNVNERKINLPEQEIIKIPPSKSNREIVTINKHIEILSSLERNSNKESLQEINSVLVNEDLEVHGKKCIKSLVKSSIEETDISEFDMQEKDNKVIPMCDDPKEQFNSLNKEDNFMINEKCVTDDLYLVNIKSASDKQCIDVEKNNLVTNVYGTKKETIKDSSKISSGDKNERFKNNNFSSDESMSYPSVKETSQLPALVLDPKSLMEQHDSHLSLVEENSLSSLSGIKNDLCSSVMKNKLQTLLTEDVPQASVIKHNIDLTVVSNTSHSLLKENTFHCTSTENYSNLPPTESNSCPESNKNVQYSVIENISHSSGTESLVMKNSSGSSEVENNLQSSVLEKDSLSSEMENSLHPSVENKDSHSSELDKNLKPSVTKNDSHSSIQESKLSSPPSDISHSLLKESTLCSTSTVNNSYLPLTESSLCSSEANNDSQYPITENISHSSMRENNLLSSVIENDSHSSEMENNSHPSETKDDSHSSTKDNNLPSPNMSHSLPKESVLYSISTENNSHLPCSPKSKNNLQSPILENSSHPSGTENTLQSSVMKNNSLSSEMENNLKCSVMENETSSSGVENSLHDSHPSELDNNLHFTLTENDSHSSVKENNLTSPVISDNSHSLQLEIDSHSSAIKNSLYSGSDKNNPDSHIKSAIKEHTQIVSDNSSSCPKIYIRKDLHEGYNCCDDNESLEQNSLTEKINSTTDVHKPFVKFTESSTKRTLSVADESNENCSKRICSVLDLTCSEESSDDEKLIIDEEKTNLKYADKFLKDKNQKGKDFKFKNKKMDSNTENLIKFKNQSPIIHCSTNDKMENTPQPMSNLKPMVEVVDLVNDESNQDSFNKSATNLNNDKNFICEKCTGTWNDKVLKLLFEGNESVTVNSRITYGAIICMNIYVSIHYPRIKEQALIGLLDRADLAKNLGSIQVSLLNNWLVALIKNKKISCCDPFRPVYKTKTSTQVHHSNGVQGGDKEFNDKQKQSIESSVKESNLLPAVDSQNHPTAEIVIDDDNDLDHHEKRDEQNIDSEISFASSKYMKKVGSTLKTGSTVLDSKGGVLTNGKAFTKQFAKSNPISYSIIQRERESLSSDLYEAYDKLVYESKLTEEETKAGKRKILTNKEILCIHSIFILNAKEIVLDKYYRFLFQLLYHRGDILLIPDEKLLVQKIENIRKEHNRMKFSAAKNKAFLSQAWDIDNLCTAPVARPINKKNEYNVKVRDILSVFCSWKNNKLLNGNFASHDLREEVLKLYDNKIEVNDCFGLCIKLYANYSRLLFNQNEAENMKTKVFLNLFYLPNKYLSSLENTLIFDTEITHFPPANGNSSDIIDYLEKQTKKGNGQVKRSYLDSVIDAKLQQAKKLKIDLLNSVKTPKAISLIETYAKLKNEMNYLEVEPASHQSFKSAEDSQEEYLLKSLTYTEEVKLIVAKLRASNIDTEYIPIILEKIFHNIFKRKIPIL